MCILESWRLNLPSSQRKTDITLQKVLLHVVKASSSVVCSCDNLMPKGNTCKDAPLPIIDSLALLNIPSLGITTKRKNLKKHKLPDNLKSFVDMPVESEILFGDDMNKIISYLSSANSAL